MAKLTQEQLRFLKSQNIDLSLVCDGSGMSASEREVHMKNIGAQFYYGGAPCRASGHTLRTKRGHCIQCDTSKINYQRRSGSRGFVYLAHSKSTDLIKVGFSQFHPQERADMLRKEAYGGIVDWDVKRVVELSKDAGKTEFAIHSKLHEFQKPLTYEKGRGNIVECKELFACPLKHALSVFDMVTSKAAKKA